MFTFKLLVKGGIVNENTVLGAGPKCQKISSHRGLCKLIFNLWKKETSSASLQDWADELNESGEFEGTFTKYDALDNLASNTIVNVDGGNPNLYEYMQIHLPEILN